MGGCDILSTEWLFWGDIVVLVINRRTRVMHAGGVDHIGIPSLYTFLDFLYSKCMTGFPVVARLHMIV